MILPANTNDVTNMVAQAMAVYGNIQNQQQQHQQRQLNPIHEDSQEMSVSDVPGSDLPGSEVKNTGR